MEHIGHFPTSMEDMPFFPGNQFLQGKKKSTLGTKLKPFMDTCTVTLDTDQKPSTSSKDTHKKGRMTATMTEEEYSTRQSTHKTQPLHQHRTSM